MEKGETPEGQAGKPGETRPAGEPTSAPVVSLQAALRRARLENAERSDVVADLRSAEGARLDLLRERIAPIVAEAHKHSDIFDLALATGEPPRLFVDILGFIEMGRDRRSYRFVQDTRHGRVLIVESESVDSIVRAVAAYCARRLIEREKALSADALFGATPETAPRTPAERANVAQKSVRASASRDPALTEEAASRAMRALDDDATSPASRPRPKPARVFGRAFLFLVEFLGSVTFFALLAGAGWLAWRHFVP